MFYIALGLGFYFFLGFVACVIHRVWEHPSAPDPAEEFLLLLVWPGVLLHALAASGAELTARCYLNWREKKSQEVQERYPPTDDHPWNHLE